MIKLATCKVSNFLLVCVNEQAGLTLSLPETLWTGPEVINFFSCSTQLIRKFIVLINVKIKTFVGILTFISMINTTSESLKASKIFIFQHFSFYEQIKFHAQLSWA